MKTKIYGIESARIYNRIGNCEVCGEHLGHYDSKFINIVTLEIVCAEHRWNLRDLDQSLWNYYTDG